MPETRIRNLDLTTTLQQLLARCDPFVNSYSIGQENGSSIALLFKTTPTSTTSIRYSTVSSKFELSNDGTNFFEIILSNNPLLHTQNTDTGTSQNDFSIGNGNPTDKTIYANIGPSNDPYFRYDVSLSRWVISNDGTSDLELGTGRLVFPLLFANQTGSFEGYILAGETEITSGSFPGETALIPGTDAVIDVQMIVTAPSTKWVNGESAIEFRQDPTTKAISLFNMTPDPIEIRMFVEPV